MPSENWCQVRVSDVAGDERNALVGGPFGSNLVSRDYVDYGVPVIRGQNMGDRWVGGDFAYVTPSKANSLSANLARPGDIIFTQRGTLGQVALVPTKPFEQYLISQSQMKLTVDQAIADPLFLYYQFRSREQQDYVRRNAIQTGVPHTNLGILRDTPVILPPLTEQKAIACMLGTLDDKIELNRRMNRTLEEMVQAIFKSWFVDFEPVWKNFQRRDAEAQGRGDEQGQPAASPRLGVSALNPAVVDLFPDGFEGSELGEIPKGWRVGSILTVGELLSGGTPSTKVPEYWGGDIKWVSAKDVCGAHGPFLLDTERTITTKGVDNSSARVLPELTTIVTARGTVGSHCMLAQPMAMNQTNYGLKAKSQNADYFVFFALGNLVHQLKQSAYGTVFDTVTTKTFETSKIVVPKDAVITEFNQRISPAMEKIRQNLLQSRTLAELRDTLLPKLISGELRVPDAERIVGRRV